MFFKPGFIRPVGRLLFWLWGALQFYFGNALDRIRGQATEQSRAVRLRHLFERGGPTFAKLAQQLSMRADMLPYAYCAELGKMLDQAAPFPTEQAVAIIERSLGRPLDAMFESLDPEPIGSASLACVYQAQLKTGERVAVKVRRPDIGPMVAADMKALDWLLIIGETLTLLPSGGARRFVEDFQTILFNEMNFRAEARYTDIFRRRAAKRKNGVTAPRVHFQFCSEEVLVSEFVSGVWMWEIMAAVDRNDQEFLARLHSMGIEPKSLASKLVMIMQREVQEEAFFHADPHPANLVVMPNNGVCFIDFGAVGRFSTKTRKTLREFQHHMIRGDVGRMVNCALTLIGPLPPLDVERVHSEMEKIYSEAVYAMGSQDAEWWEKSAAQGWLRFMEVAREFNLPASMETVQLFRTTFAYDAVIIRLHKDMDITKEWQAYFRQAGKEARLRVKKKLKQRLRGPTDLDYLAMEEAGDMIQQLMFQLQRGIENPIVHFRNIVGKIAFTIGLFLSIGYLGVLAFGAGWIADTVARKWFDYQIDWAAILERATTFGWVQLVLIAVVVVIIRRIMVRLSLPDTRLDADR
ncbi:MAG: AarF/ABC1/UbiB kinase family protein [Hyphomicrobiales bacterium]|nr:AarF/ABC1/UbiB kinase family protein [Hyphomicrobiales bacterium]